PIALPFGWRFCDDAFAGRPFPVFPEKETAAECSGPRNTHMGISPMSEPRVFAEILDPDIVAAHPGVFAIGDDNLAVVAVIYAGRAIELQELVSVIEPGHLDPCLPQFPPVTFGHAVAAHIVVEQIDFYALSCLGDQALSQLLAQSVIAHD